LLRRPGLSSSAADENQHARSLSDAAAIAAAIWQANQSDKHSSPAALAVQPSRWRQEGRREQLDRLP
jgi:hypothetical protein